MKRIGAKRRTHEERRAESELKLTDALIEIINTEGISAATCENIADLAGYSRGLTTVRLGKRDEMFSRLVNRLRIARLQKVRASLAGVKNRRGALETFVDMHFEDLENDPSYVAYFVLLAGSLTEIQQLRSSIIKAHEFVRDFLVELIEDGIETGEFDPEVDAIGQSVALGSYLIGTAIQHRINLKVPVSVLKDGAYELIPKSRTAPSTSKREKTT